jgi:dethiobiotin synthetase
MNTSLEAFVSNIKKSKSKASQNIFISGTDTGIGKTFATSLMVRKFNEAGIRTVGMKPICCGDRSDSEVYWKLTKKTVPLNVINPIHLTKPLAPTAQKCPSWTQMLIRIRKALSLLKTRYQFELILIEGAGGLLCPITSRRTMRDLVTVLDSSLIFIVPNKLGVLNHTLLSIEAAQKENIEIKGVILNQNLNLKNDPSKHVNFDTLRKIVKFPLYSF